MPNKVHEVCGACKGEFIFTGRAAWWMVIGWRESHKCDGPQLTYLFQSAEMPSFGEFEDDES